MQNILTIPAQGCTLGLTLWYTSVLPSLLPFFILSGLLIRTGAFRFLNRIFSPVLTRIFPVSSDGSYAILMGYLCGFPMGAKVIAELVAHQHISREEGSYLMVFCNNVSPAFLSIISVLPSLDSQRCRQYCSACFMVFRFCMDIFMAAFSTKHRFPVTIFPVLSDLYIPVLLL